MHDRRQRFHILSESVKADDATTTLAILDTDTQHKLSLSGPASYLDVAGDSYRWVEIMTKYMNYLSPRVEAITINERGLLTSVSSIPSDDDLDDEDFWDRARTNLEQQKASNHCPSDSDASLKKNITLAEEAVDSLRRRDMDWMTEASGDKIERG
ncbi:hypothetical protein BKA67DRAFT_665081 [Truncatella angustata]|uniref:Uncharacterized protein n=1 Tax=Truncatella angustata TaxID=152316 RepID=A0A9P8RIC5_9PEZI|nr:uncharacterized protein BKA67DRAFT_665081 [Truncatella angustata]KAH6643255.1 hypothetical protein BKA67DRAFT_665081 [Truncatella angustata]KAH8199025.1 hypothetical protein TruAng_006811 [Truncatella angustata]